MVPWIRKNYPDLFLLVGSTVDSETIVQGMKRRHPYLRTVAEIADMDVDGFVSMLNWTQASLEKYAPTHLIAPTAMTVGEAMQQTVWGAQLQKLAGSDIGFVRRCRGDAAFDYCPIMVTGGQRPEAMEETFAAGAVAVGAGFDLMLKGQPATTDVKAMTAALRTYLDAAQAARNKAWPELAAAIGGPKQAWLDALPHVHPF